MPWWTPQMTGQEIDLIRDVLASGYLNDGDVTTRFEAELASRIGVRHVVAVTSGTAAIFLALVAAGVEPGDEVIVPDLTFIATANAVRLAGATVVLADIEPRALGLDPARFEQAITPRTRAVIPVHVSGRASDITSIVEIADRHGIAVIEDAAEALMSAHQDRHLGTFGIAGCFSFSPNKTVTTGQGGAVATNDDALHDRLRELKDQGRPVRGTGGDDQHPSIGFNFKLTNLQAAVGIAQLRELDTRLERQRAIHAVYAEGLRGIPGIELPGFRLADGETPQWTDAIAERRTELVAHLESAGMGCRRFWLPIHTQAPYRRSDRDFPVASALSPKLFWLPSAFTLSDDDIRSVCARIRSLPAS